jgi:hypothetical protein
MARFGFFTDAHLTENRPVHRIDDYINTIPEKIEMIYDFAAQNEFIPASENMIYAHTLQKHSEVQHCLLYVRIAPILKYFGNQFIWKTEYPSTQSTNGKQWNLLKRPK